MARHEPTLPNCTEPMPRMMVASRLVGPLLAAIRDQRGYRVVVETDRHGETCAWLVRNALRML